MLQVPHGQWPGHTGSGDHTLRLAIRPDVLRMRQLVLAEAGRFPELART